MKTFKRFFKRFRFETSEILTIRSALSKEIDINQKVGPRYNLQFNRSSWGLMELEARITKILEENREKETLEIPLIDIISTGISGDLLARHSIRCVEDRRDLFLDGDYKCSKIYWVPRFVTVQLYDYSKINIPLTIGEREVGMPKKIFQPWDWISSKDIKVDDEVQDKLKRFWIEKFNLIRSSYGSRINVIHLSQVHSLVNEDCVYILNRSLQTVTQGTRQISNVDWVPHSLQVSKI